MKITGKKSGSCWLTPSQQVSIPWLSWIQLVSFCVDKAELVAFEEALLAHFNWSRVRGSRESLSGKFACSHVLGWSVNSESWFCVLGEVDESSSLGGSPFQVPDCRDWGCGGGETFAVISIITLLMFWPRESWKWYRLCLIWKALTVPAHSSQQIPIKMFWNCPCVFLNGHFPQKLQAKKMLCLSSLSPSSLCFLIS